MKRTKIYSDNIDAAAIEQFDSAMEQPFTVEGALMPDAHKGYSLPIGAVVATKGVVVPAWVGYDIGCGMCALKLDGINIHDIRITSKLIFEGIYSAIPVGFNKNTKVGKYSDDRLTEQGKVIANKKEYRKSLCSLGGGNHFIEIGVDESDDVWVIVHSGSRGVGHGIASYYMSLASNDPEKAGTDFDLKNTKLKKFNPDGYDVYRAKYIAKQTGKSKPKEGHFSFDVNSKNGKDYIQDLNWCLDYALENRKQMILRTVDVIKTIINMPDYTPDIDTLINRNHNHVVEKDGLWIHRKGATHAEDGFLGVIPGNMRDGSFIVRGKGNPESLYSSSHGAGRVLGRKQAERELKTKDFIDIMIGITAKVDSETLDESPMAYKDIFEVMRLQSDLVEVLYHVKPIINIKG